MLYKYDKYYIVFDDVYLKLCKKLNINDMFSQTFYFDLLLCENFLCQILI